MTKAMIIVNPSSGGEKSEDYIEQLKEQVGTTYTELTIKKTKESTSNSKGITRKGICSNS